MDMRMPVMDGYEATRRIRATDRGQAVAIVALTASAFEEDRSLILSAGCNAFIRKPFRAHEIFDVLASLLGVQFIYDETNSENTPPTATRDTSTSATFTTDNLARLPAAWVARVHRAALLGNGRTLHQLAAEIEEQHPAIASELQALADDFHFDQIVAITGPLADAGQNNPADAS
jgi:CheY-like chemotaxis protein